MFNTLQRNRVQTYYQRLTQMVHNLAFLLKNSVDIKPDHLALQDHGTRLSYGNLWGEVSRVASLLEELEAPSRCLVGLFFPNRLEFPIFYYATIATGRVAMPINPMLKREELAYQLMDAEVEYVVTTASLIPVILAALEDTPKLKSLLKSVIVIDGSAGGPGDQEHPVFETLSRVNYPLFKNKINVKKSFNPFPTTPHDTAVILYTSGTTGRPKGAELTHHNLISNVETLMPVHQILGETPWKSLLVLPLFHSFGQTVIQNTTFALGGSLFLLERFDPWQTAEWIEKHEVSVFAGVPTMYYGLLNHPSVTPTMLRSLRLCVCGGAPMPEEVMRRFNQTFKTDIIEAYGLSETAPVAAMNPPFGLKKTGSIGVPVENVEFRLLDENGKVITQPHTPGELYIKGPNVMKGYFKKPAETEAVLQKGWFRTGDIAQRDADGYYRLVDRAKDLIIRGGFNVYPREIEERLYHHPDVLEAAVVGVPDERLGEEICGIVSLRPGAKTTEDELIAYCKEHLAAYKYPRKVQIVDQLPKGPTGKILKRVLRGTIKIPMENLLKNKN